MKNEVARLKKDLAQARKAIDALQKHFGTKGKGQGFKASKVVVDSLEVVNFAGEVVASIDSMGRLFCRSVWASTGQNTRGVFLNGENRKVSAGSLELIPLDTNSPGLEAAGDGSAGSLQIRNRVDNQRLCLQGDGAPIIAYEVGGGMAAMVAVNELLGGHLYLKNPSSEAEVKLGISHLTGSGELNLSDAQGKIIVHLPE